MEKDFYNRMKIHILTTQKRDSTPVVAFWQSQGWQPITHDNTGHPCGHGRNQILEEFYSSSEPWLAMADDDMIIDTNRGWAHQFLSNPQRLLHKMGQEITSWGLMNNIHHRVDTTLRNPAVQQDWVFYRASWIGCLVFHRNTGQRFYNHPTDVMQDMDWCLQQLQAGHRVAHCMNLVQKNTTSTSTIFASKSERRQKYLAAKQRIAREYPLITLTPTNRLVKTRFINKYSPITPPWASVADIGPCLRIKP